MNSDFKKVISDIKSKVDADIKSFFSQKKRTCKNNFLKRNYDLIEQFTLNGGKRLRPIALIMAYKGFGGRKDVVRTSLSVELFHNSSLIHDDLMDEDDFRRNKPTVYNVLKTSYLKVFKEQKYNGSLFNRISSKAAVSDTILLGNITYILGSQILSDSDFDNKKIVQAIKVYDEAFRVVNEGQILDLKLEKQSRATEKEYIEMAEKKTAHLVKACIEIGGIMAGADETRLRALSNSALNMTLAFQIKDDLMDIQPDMNKGRELGSDLKQGKKTLLVIKALELGDKKEKKAVLKVLGKNKVGHRQLEDAITALHISGAFNYCEQLAKKKILNAKKWLKKASLNKKSHEFFDELADYVLNRNI